MVKSGKCEKQIEPYLNKELYAKQHRIANDYHGAQRSSQIKQITLNDES